MSGAFPMTTNETTARDRAAEMAEHLDWTADNATGYAQLERVAREAAGVLRALAGVPDQTADRAAIERVRTPEPPAGSEHYREGWRDGYEQRGIDIRRALDGDAGEEER